LTTVINCERSPVRVRARPCSFAAVGHVGRCGIDIIVFEGLGGFGHFLLVIWRKRDGFVPNLDTGCITSTGSGSVSLGL
jgi:hypothetical protein